MNLEVTKENITELMRDMAKRFSIESSTKEDCNKDIQVVLPKT